MLYMDADDPWLGLLAGWLAPQTVTQCSLQQSEYFHACCATLPAGRWYQYAVACMRAGEFIGGGVSINHYGSTSSHWQAHSGCGIKGNNLFGEGYQPITSRCAQGRLPGRCSETHQVLAYHG